MADFELAVAKTIANEGCDKYTETFGDRGGATKYGISSKFLLSIFEDNDVKNYWKHPVFAGHINISINPTINEIVKELTRLQAWLLYKTYFWDANRYGEIEDQDIANKVFDMGVLFGCPCSNRILQRSLGMDEESIDGIIGKKTLELENSCCSIIPGLDNILDNIKTLFTHHCLAICNKDKTQEKFLLGWLNRVMS